LSAKTDSALDKPNVFNDSYFNSLTELLSAIKFAALRRKKDDGFREAPNLSEFHKEKVENIDSIPFHTLLSASAASRSRSKSAASRARVSLVDSAYPGPRATPNKRQRAAAASNDTPRKRKAPAAKTVDEDQDEQDEEQDQEEQEQEDEDQDQDQSDQDPEHGEEEEDQDDQEGEGEIIPRQPARTTPATDEPETSPRANKRMRPGDILPVGHHAKVNHPPLPWPQHPRPASAVPLSRPASINPPRQTSQTRAPRPAATRAPRPSATSTPRPSSQAPRSPDSDRTSENDPDASFFIQQQKEQQQQSATSPANVPVGYAKKNVRGK
jgi:hypothetical protein